MANEENRRKARKAYIFERLSIPTIAVMLGVSQQTVRRWKKKARDEIGDDWDFQKSANAMAGQGLEPVVVALVEDVVLQAQAIMENVKGNDAISAADKIQMITQLADALNKMVGAAGRIAPKVSELGVAMDVIKRLSEYIREHRPDLADTFLEVLEPFAADLTEAYT